MVGKGSIVVGSILITIGSQPIMQGRAKIIQGAKGLRHWFYTAVRLYKAMQVFCMVERTIIIGSELFDYSRKIIIR